MSSPVITGIGVIAPTGVGVDEHWQAVLAGKLGIARISRFDAAGYPVQLAGEVTGVSVKELLPRRLVPQIDRWTQLAVLAGEYALADAKLNPAELPEYEMAVVTSSSSGGTEFGQNEMTRLYRNGPSHVGAYQSIAWFYAATTGQLSIKHGMRGPCGVLACEQAGGLDALGQVRRLLRREARLVISGGTDASLCPYGVVAQLPIGYLSTSDDPEQAYLPFDADAAGYVPGEGGAIFTVETAESARERGAPNYGAILGYAAGFDPPPGSERPPVLRRTIERAIADAGLLPSDVDVVFADAMGVPDKDLAESQAISAVFGPGAVPVTAPKTLTGRLYGGGAPLDVATALLALRDGIIPHTAGPTELAPGIDIDLVLGQPRPAPLRTALVLARGYGGFTSALVLGAGDRTA
ncbi:MAG TPA: ketosynthase chain-length factor [Pseudonocardiaceae bacterium]|jgi:act minimal PKS chain-length factor (CLF/KS beta)